MSEENKKQSKWQQREIGALWKNEGRNQKYLAGHVKMKDGTEQKVVIFSNKNRSSDKAPHFRVYMSEDPPASVETKATSFDDVTSESSQDDADLI
tara:strand:- start:268 stop:552 length:285 start_codon:yes stop_codon:yes gene_type:complete